MINWDEPEPPPLFCEPLLSIEQLHVVAQLQRECLMWQERYEDLLARARRYTKDQELV